VIHPKHTFAHQIPQGSAVLDVGCWNYSFYRYCQQVGAVGLCHYGVDRQVPSDPSPPPEFSFELVDVDTSPLPFKNEMFDAVVASHITEHLRDPMRMMDEVFRVLKVGGTLYLECPSDRSLRFPSMPFCYEQFRSLNFYDDPTHFGRPHTPQSLFRLLKMYDAEVLECRYLTSPRVRWLFPWYVLRSLLQRDAATLERAFG
jgi:SAM-dependent methyltransferase